MKLDRLAGCAAWLLASAGAFAQPAPATLPAPEQPAPQPIIIHSKEYVGSHEPGPQDPQAAREEAGAALAEARTQCRRERDRDTRNQCLREAQDRYREAMQAPVR